MNITLAQIRLKTGDFEYNYNSVRKAVEKSKGDIIVAPECMLEDIGGKDLILDAAVRQLECNFFERIAKDFPDKKIFLGGVYIKNGEVLIS